MYNRQNKGINVNPNRSGVRNAPAGMRINPNRKSSQNMTQREWIISKGGTGRIEKPHPLDVAGAKRVMGKVYFDPISKKWKEDDLRPRGASWIPPSPEFPQGKWVWWCAGRCRSGRWWWGNKISCPCDGKRNNCRCVGCHDGGSC
jgi:hypothetical protein